MKLITPTSIPWLAMNWAAPPYHEFRVVNWAAPPANSKCMIIVMVNKIAIVMICWMCGSLLRVTSYVVDLNFYLWIGAGESMEDGVAVVLFSLLYFH